MSGLFRRARAYRTRFELLGEDINDSDFVLEIADDERANVLTGIDSMLKDDRIQRDEGAMQFLPKKRANTLPLMLNVGALVVLAAGAFVAWQLFERDETAIVSDEADLVSAEGLILERLKQDAEAELSAKEQEIAGILALMSDLEGQRDLLAAETDALVAEREQELQSEFDTALAAERARLAEIGVSETNITTAMATFEAEIRERFDADLEAARQQAAADEARRAAELDTQRLAYEAQIAAANEEQDKLLEEMEALATEGRAEADAIAQELRDLQESQERDRLINDQILSLYRQVGDARRGGNSDEALATLETLENYLSEDTIRGTAIVAERRDVDRFLIGAVRRLVSMETDTAPVESGESAAILAALVAGAGAGTSLFESGNVAAARSTWQEAFSAVPELEAAFETAYAQADDAAAAAAVAAGAAAAGAAELAAARDAGFAAGRQAALADIGAGNEAALSAARNEGYTAGREDALADVEGSTESAVAAAREDGYDQGYDEGYDEGRDEEAAEAAVVINNLRDQLSDLNTRLSDTLDRFTSSLFRSREQAEALSARTIELLSEKVKIKAAMDSSMHERLDAYTDAAGAMEELDGRTAVYAEIVEYLSEIAGE